MAENEVTRARMLVVDDEADIRELLSMTLSKMGTAYLLEQPEHRTSISTYADTASASSG